MKEPGTKDESLSLFFGIAFALPIVVTIIVAFVAGVPGGLVTNELSPAAVVVVMAMVHAPTIAAVVVVSRRRGWAGIKTLFGQLKHWSFAPRLYLAALLIFPVTMLAVLSGLSLISPNFAPVLSLSVLAFAGLTSALWEEIGWTGFATPVMLKYFSPLKVGLLLGFVHALWHLPASIYGSSAFHGDLFAVNFLSTSVGIIGLRIVTVWIYAQSQSLVLGWLTHASFTGGQLLLVPLTLTSRETIVWNTAFSLLVMGIVAFLLVRSRGFNRS